MQENVKRTDIAGKIADNISDLIYIKKQEGINAKKQAEEIGITASSLSKYTSGQAIPDGISLHKMAEYYNCSADYLLGLTSNPSTDLKTAEITKILGLSLESINELKHLNFLDKLSSNLDLRVVNMLLESKTGQEFLTDLTILLFSKMGKFYGYDENKNKIDKMEINVDSDIVTFNLFPPEAEAILYFELQEKIKKLKNSIDFKKLKNKINAHHVIIRKAPDDYKNFLAGKIQQTK